MLETQQDLSEKEVKQIKARFYFYSTNLTTLKQMQFQRLMGLLSIGQCSFLCKRLFDAASKGKQQITLQDFISFINTLNNGSFIDKAKLSFNYMCSKKKDKITIEVLQKVTQELCLLWNFLTQEKVHHGAAIQLIQEIFDIEKGTGLFFDDYFMKYDRIMNWYQFFNELGTTKEMNQKSQKAQFSIEQMEEYLKFINTQVTTMMLQLKESSESQQDSTLGINDSFLKGPIHISSQPFQLKGDVREKKITKPVLKTEQLESEVEIYGDNRIEQIHNKLTQICNTTYKLFPAYKKQFCSRTESIIKAKTLLRESTQKQVRKGKKLSIEDENWNLMLNLMVGIRKALKSYYYHHKETITFTIQDIASKYNYQLIYRRNNESIAQLSQIFVDYAPKLFAYLRKLLNIQNWMLFQSLGLQNLIGNLVMGDLCSFIQRQDNTENTFHYYSYNYHLRIEQLNKQQSHLCRGILQNYINHFKKYQMTFLPKIYGMHKLKNKNTNRQIYFLVHENLRPNFHPHIQFQVKGDFKFKNSKNNDFDLVNSRTCINLPKLQKQKIFEMIKKDTELLEQHNMINYGLYIGISNDLQKVKMLMKDPYIFISEKKRQMYYFRLFNMFEQYSTTKLIGNKIKSMFSKQAQVIPPKQYREKFLAFIANYVFSS